ncbi:SDR family NAD(P)-dependent oxidoreductase [Citricoccus sp. K5]|uniref:SDR family NAD(P)-dependent oxidoreductase n=1 Tax=Citricoccus sp. K5 TaxID=2653135 RepID=UPI0012F4323B|nr:SDR family NAD(P)-dependent oxidoreductase [Citricoccus sp. K5]VXA90817.1 3-oxoacyl-(acyl-carrier protein) reductase [Citricoccus sp. K5]
MTDEHHTPQRQDPAGRTEGASANAGGSHRPLAGQVALVTGCGKPDGMGQGIAGALASRGASLVITDREPRGVANDRQRRLGQVPSSGLDEFAGQLRRAGVDVVTALGDISQRADVAGILQTVQDRFGRLDILVNNAAAPQGPDRRDIEEVPDEAFDLLIDVNVRGTYAMCRAAVPLMRSARYGRIVNISSMAGLSAAPFSVAYSASKAAVIGLTRALSMDVGPWGITVNAVCPGLVATSRAILDPSADLDVDSTLAQRGRNIPVGRVGQPADIGELVSFLASPGAGYVTGQAIPVDGGGLTPFPLRQPPSDT